MSVYVCVRELVYMYVYVRVCETVWVWEIVCMCVCVWIAQRRCQNYLYMPIFPIKLQLVISTCWRAKSINQIRIHAHACNIYIYIYIGRERGGERERGRKRSSPNILVTWHVVINYELNLILWRYQSTHLLQNWNITQSRFNLGSSIESKTLC